MKPLNKTSIAYALAAIFLWSTVASAFKIALAGMSSLQLLFIASWTSVTVLIIVLLTQRKLRQFLSQSWSDWLYSAGLGFLYPLVYYLLLFGAYQRLPAQQAQPLNYTWPILFSLLSVPFMGRSLSTGSMIALGVSFVGVVFISTKGEPTNLQDLDLSGSFLALASGLVWAFFWIFNLKDQREPILKLTSGFLIGALYVTILVMLTGTPFPPNGISVYCSYYVGLFEMGITFILWLKALEEDHQEVLINNLAYISPFLSLVFIHFILGEEIRASSLVGLALIVTGIGIQTASQRKTI